jgi:hypothetical protein
MGRASNERQEAQRRAWCRQRAKFRFHFLNDGRLPFPEILERIKRRWPVSCSGDDFADELQRLFEQEQAERVEWLQGLARRLFKRWHDPRWQFARLEKYIRLRKPRLAKDPAFAAELRRCFDAAHAPDPQPSENSPMPTPAGPRTNATG